MFNNRLIHHTLCRLLAGPADAGFAATFSADDWRRLAERAHQTGVAPLLYHTLKQQGRRGEQHTRRPSSSSLIDRPDIPPDVWSELRHAHSLTAAVNLLIYRELSRIFAVLAVANPWPPPAADQSQYAVRKTQYSPIPTIVLKGAALATTLYPNIALRPLGDVDLLVPEDRLSEAVARLKTMGYVEPIPEMAAGLNTLAGHHIHLQGGQDIHLAVDLHWTLIGSEHDWRSPSLPWFWTQTEEWRQPPALITQHAIRSTQYQPSILTLTPTANLLYLAAHLMLQHGSAQARLLWFYEIHLLIQRQAAQIDWGELARRAREFRWSPALHAALQGVHERFDTPIPSGLLETLAADGDADAWRLVRRKAGSLQTRAMQTWTTATALDWQARRRLALALVLPCPAYMRWRYKPRPAWLWPLYYPYRWLDILREGLSTLWRIAKGQGRASYARSDLLRLR